MATDFAVFLRRFLAMHLAGLRGCSPNTIASYRDTFKLLIVFLRDGRAIPIERLTLDRIDAAAVTGFLDWLEVNRHNSVSTRNQRLAAISSFFRWMQSQDPTQLARCQDILAIPAKRQTHPAVHHGPERASQTVLKTVLGPAEIARPSRRPPPTSCLGNPGHSHARDPPDRAGVICVVWSAEGQCRPLAPAHTTSTQPSTVDMKAALI